MGEPDPFALAPVDLFAPRVVRLRDGEYLLRPLHPGDEQLLQKFFQSHSPETVYRRYGYALAEMSDRRARELVGVDQRRDPAFGIFDLEGCRHVLHAVGRYFLEEGGGECAFVTRESKRGVGMGTLLLRTLIAVARARGLDHLWAQVQADNGPMLGLLSAHGFQLKPAPGGDVVEARLRLTLVEGRRTPVGSGVRAEGGRGRRR